MTEFLNSLQNPHFVLTTIVLAICVNLASSYLKRSLDNILKHISGHYRKLVLAREAQHKKKIMTSVANIQRNPLHLHVYTTTATVAKLNSWRDMGGVILYVAFAMVMYKARKEDPPLLIFDIPYYLLILYGMVTFYAGYYKAKILSEFQFEVLLAYLESEASNQESLEPPVDISPDQ